MKAIVYTGPFKVAVEDVPRSKIQNPNDAIQNPNDAIVKITTTAICGSDLYTYEGRTTAIYLWS
jgi:glutathione-independent formaldehyde dehydrogenase